MTQSDSLYQTAVVLGELAREAGVKVTVAESCTGGGVAHAITSVPGSSVWFELGVVTYSNHMKTQLLGVPGRLLHVYGAVSEPVAAAMVSGALELASADYAAAISGIAGPDGGTLEKPVGTVCFGWGSSQRTRTSTELFLGDREDVRNAAIEYAMAKLIDLIKAAVGGRGSGTVLASKAQNTV